MTKLSRDGSGLAYSTYLGGYGDIADSVIDYPGTDHAFGIAVDSFGHAYATGETWSSNYYCAGSGNPISCCTGGGTGTCNFPVTADAFQSTDNASNFDNPGPNAFVTKMSLDGSGLVYSTYLGGSGAHYGDRGFAIAVDSVGDAYVTGSAYSTDFPITAGTFQTAGGNGDAFVTKLIVPAGPTPTPTATGTATKTATPTATPTPGGGRISVTPKQLSLSALPSATASASITISNTGTGPLIVNVTAPKHNPPFTEVGEGNAIVVPEGGPAHAVTIVYSPTKKGSTKDSITITSDDPTHKKAIKLKLKGKSK